MDRTLHARTRRPFLHEGFVAGLALVASLGALPLADVAASKNDGRKAKSIAKRAKVYENACKAGRGTATVTKLSGGTTVACTGSNAGDWSCTVHSKGSRCHATHTSPPTGGIQPADGDGGGDRPWQHDVPDDLPVLEPVEEDGSDPVLT